jgi:hypothetical protein
VLIGARPAYALPKIYPAWAGLFRSAACQREGLPSQGHRNNRGESTSDAASAFDLASGAGIGRARLGKVSAIAANLARNGEFLVLDVRTILVEPASRFARDLITQETSLIFGRRDARRRP